MKEKHRVYSIDLLRVIACMLITNSHFDGVYPLNISWGGCPGNCLFFMISGFLLAGTDFKNSNFKEWYWKKIIKIYIPLEIVAVIGSLIKYYTFRPSLFIFPVEQFWFIPTIVILYAVYFFIRKHADHYRFVFICIDFVVYIFFYLCVFNTNVFFVERHIIYLVLYGFVAMMIGSHILERRESYKDKNITYCIIIACLSIVGFLGIKLLINKNSILALKLQFLTHIFSILFSIALMIAMLTKEGISERIIKERYIGKFLTIISSSTLEIYLVQYMIISYLKQLAFPINFIIICISIVTAGFGVHWISDKILKSVEIFIHRSDQ